jgi:hypothetical protein
MAAFLGLFFALLHSLAFVAGRPQAPAQAPLQTPPSNATTIPATLFAELEELSRIVDIAYCVGTAGLGISKPFQCVSRCSEFPNFELINVGLTLDPASVHTH